MRLDSFIRLAKMGLSSQERRLLDIRRGQLSRELEHELFSRNIQIAVDGSIVQDGDDVYVLDAPFQNRVDRILFFSDMYYGVPIAQFCADEAMECAEAAWLTAA